MNLQSLLSHYGSFVVPALLIGIATSFAFRTRAWVFFLWLPVTGFCAYATFSLLGEIATILSMHGPEGGFAGMALVYLVPALALSITGLTLSLITSPRRDAWRWAAVAPAFLLWTAVTVLSDSANGTSFHIVLLDVEGKPLANIRTELIVHENGLDKGYAVLTSDAKGNVDVRLRRNQSVEIKFEPASPSPAQRYQSPAYWTIDADFLRDAPDQIAVRHLWWRSIGEIQLSEGYKEILPAKHDIHFPLVLPPYESLDPKPRIENIRAAFIAAQRKHYAQDSNYAYICRNVESIDLIPLLVRTYKQNEAQRQEVIDALAGVAEIVSDLDKGSKQVMLYSEPYHSHEQTAYEIRQLCDWANVPTESRNDKVQVGRLIQGKITTIVQELADFVFEELADDPEVIKVFGNLRRLGHTFIPQMLKKIKAQPPMEWRDIHQWSHNLRMVGVHFNELEPLFASDNPTLVLLAVEATPNSELEGANASKAAQRLETVYPNMQKEGMQQRADMFIKMLNAHTHEYK